MSSNDPLALHKEKSCGRASGDNLLESQGRSVTTLLLFLKGNTKGGQSVTTLKPYLKTRARGGLEIFFMINLLVCSVILIDEEEGTSDMVLKNIRCHTRSINI